MSILSNNDNYIIAFEAGMGQFDLKTVMHNSVLKERTKRLAHNVIKLIAMLPANNALSHVIRFQLAKSCTSVPANYRAACLAASLRNFCHKMDIVLEECDETLFWLEFILEEKLISHDLLTECIEEATELTKIFTASRKTARKRLNSKK